jgi:tetratricopeptide (TPR) repeat protein
MSAPRISIENFLKGQYALIAEPSSAFATSIRSCLMALGMPPDNIMVSHKFADCRHFINEKKPKILVTEYKVEDFFGLELVEIQGKLHDEISRIAIVVTKSPEDSTVAEAAEEQVDAFLLKPFSSEDFRKKIMSVLDKKANPSPYMIAIKQAKDLLAAKQINDAFDLFIKAKALSSQPTLACHYAAQCLKLNGKTGAALEQLREGRRYQKLNYNCLTGEFDILMNEKKYAEAYELVGLLKDNFPLTPRQLSQVFMASIFTYNFADVALHYALFLKLEHRPAEVVKVTSMALFTAGRYYLEKKELATALDLFDKGLLATGRDLAFLEQIVDELLKAKEIDAAQRFLAKAPQSNVGSAEHSRLVFKVDQMTLPPGQLIERGRQIVMSGNGTPEIYKIVVRLMAEEGKTTLAEAVISRAVSQDPNLREPLYKILDAHSAKPSAA